MRGAGTGRRAPRPCSRPGRKWHGRGFAVSDARRRSRWRRFRRTGRGSAALWRRRDPARQCRSRWGRAGELPPHDRRHHDRVWRRAECAADRPGAVAAKPSVARRHGTRRGASRYRGAPHPFHPSHFQRQNNTTCTASMAQHKPDTTQNASPLFTPGTPPTLMPSSPVTKLNGRKIAATMVSK